MQKIAGWIKSFCNWLRRKMPFVIVTTLLIMIVTAFLLPRVVITIHSGEAGVLYRRFGGGTVVDYVFPEGIYVIWPFDTMFHYDMRVQNVLHEFNVLTNKGLPIHLKLSIRFYPEYELIGLLHQRVGPDYLTKVIIPQVESVLRKSLGSRDPEDIYTNKEGILTSILEKGLSETGQKYVHIDEIIIRTVELPEAIKRAIEEKLVYEQQMQAYGFRLEKERREAERKVVEAEGIKNYQKIIAETLDDSLLKWQGIQATLELAKSNNAKIVIIGDKNGLPVILNANQ